MMTRLSVQIFLILTYSFLFPKTVFISESTFNLKTLAHGDSVLFKRGGVYFTNIDLVRFYNPENIYFGSYGDTSLSKPIINGSIFSFDFDAKKWKDYEVIKGVKFYKKEIKGMESVENIYADKEHLTMAREPDIDETVITGMKNSFTGFFRIDSVDSAQPRKVFYDMSEKNRWVGAELVTKTQQWNYEVRKINGTENKFEAEEELSYPFRKNWGYFIQRHFEALDRAGEWFYDEAKGILYFSPVKNKCRIYISSGREDKNAGFDIKSRNKIIIDGLILTNFKYGIKMEKSEAVEIKNCEFYNCTYGVINKTTYLERIKVENNIFRNMHSYGVRMYANNSVISRNTIDSTGLSLGCESRGYDNLDGIELVGKNNIISYNTIRNTGYCGIRIYNCSGTKIIYNLVENTDQQVADGGSIYTYHSDEGNKLIRGNRVINSFGNVSGTDGDEDHACGIYLDEMSLHFRIDSNYVSNTGTGIYIQNSRSDTVMFNTTEKNRKYEFTINHAGTILNGGKLNPDNDPDFNPDRLDSIPNNYLWDKLNKVLYYINGRNKKPVYLEPGNNLIENNIFNPDKEKYTFGLTSWRNISEDIVFELTGNSDFFRNNVPEKCLKDASLQIIGGNVKDFYQGGKNFDVLKNTFDKTRYDYLRKVHIYIGRGGKYPVEK
jgi:parallel beta-helix repeat protein